MAETSNYTGLITSEHSDKPKYMAMVGAVAQPLVDALNVSQGMPDDFDLDTAIGVQLDQVGLWIGIGRRINTPLTGVYFSFDTVGLGFDQGVWKGPFDPDTGVIELDDETYRLLLRAKIAANHWDGMMETSKPILDAVFNPDGGAEFLEVTANNEMFALGDGVSTAFQLRYQGQAVYTTTSMTIYKTDWQGLQQLYPTPRTNLALRSEEFDNAYWPKTNITVSSDVAVAPNGTMTADRLIEDAAPGNHSIVRTITGLSNTTYIWSVWLKAAERTMARVQVGGFAGQVEPGNAIDIDLVTGSWTANDPLRVTVVGYPDGWWRVSSTVTVVNVNSNMAPSVYLRNAAGQVTYLGDGVSGIYVWGGQWELGNKATSYIPTVAATVSVTDYSVEPFNVVALPTPLALDAALSWTGQGTAYAAGTYAFIEDNQDMSMTIGIAGTIPSAIALALISGGYISLKPSGVWVNYYIATSVDNAPLFGFDADNEFVAGFDKGAWGTIL